MKNETEATAAKQGSEEAEGASGPRQKIIQFIQFGLVGVMNTGVDLLVFTLLVWAGVYYMIAQVAAYAAGTLNSYVVNKLWTFRSRRGDAQAQAEDAAGSRAEFLRFAVLNSATMLLSLILLSVFKDGMGMSSLPAKLLVTCFTVVANFFGSKLWVFR